MKRYCFDGRPWLPPDFVATICFFSCLIWAMLLGLVWLGSDKAKDYFCRPGPETRIGWVVWAATWPGREAACWLAEPIDGGVKK